MRAKEIIVEQHGLIDSIIIDYELDDEHVKMANLIKKSCMHWVNEIGLDNIFTKNAWRSVSRTNSSKIIKKSVRLNNRSPLDSSEDLHKELNNYFINNFGAPYRNALFVSGDVKTANEYADSSSTGVVYQIFPIGDYTYVWSEKIDDLWTAYSRFTPEYEMDLSKFNKNRKAKAFIGYLLSNNFFTNKNLSKGLSVGSEIMIRCKEYIGIKQYIIDDLTSRQELGIKRLIEL